MSWSDEGRLDFLYSDGDAVPVAQLKLAAFEKQRGLKLLDAKIHLFTATASVGAVGYGELGAAPFGKISGHMLESIPPERYRER